MDFQIRQADTDFIKDNLVKNSHLRRCSICNKTNVSSLALYPEDYSPQISLSADPRDETKVICSECSDSVFDAIAEFGWDDEKENE